MIKFHSRFSVSWVLINEIAIGRAPRKKIHLEIIKEKNIKSILSLCDVEEANPPKEMKDMFICKRLVLPDHRKGKEPSVSELIKVLNILKELRLKGSVYVHCVAAMERSPLICLAWLMKEKNLSSSEALDYLMQVHPRTNPLSGQLAVLKDPIFENYLEGSLK